jgi:hypothetical protein
VGWERYQIPFMMKTNKLLSEFKANETFWFGFAMKKVWSNFCGVFFHFMLASSDFFLIMKSLIAFRFAPIFVLNIQE